MELEEAKKIINHVAAERVRWGKLYDVSKDSTYYPWQIADAAVLMVQEFNNAVENTVSNEELTKLKRQLTAADAREGKRTKQVDELKKDRDEWKALAESYEHANEETIAVLKAKIVELQSKLEEVTKS